MDLIGGRAKLGYFLVPFYSTRVFRKQMFWEKKMPNQTFNVRTLGAIGDGVTNDTVAFQNAISSALNEPQATIQVPAGRYLLSAPLFFQKGPAGSAQEYNVSIEGEGAGSILLHSGADALFAFVNHVFYFNVSDITVVAQDNKSGVGQAVFNFAYGVEKSKFRSINIEPGPGNPSCFFFCPREQLNDTIEFTNVQIVNVTSLGIHFGRGSSIFYNGGRIIGSGFNAGSAGIYCPGGLGGVYINNVDIIAHSIGINLAQDSGATNQQFFLSNVTLDSCGLGLEISDNSYVSWSGTWAASCDIGINFQPATSDATINLSGGTLANCGGLGGSFGYGFSYNGKGRVQMTGLVVNANRGGGFVMGQPAQVPILITGCQFFNNQGLGNIFAQPGLTQTGNVLE